MPSRLTEYSLVRLILQCNRWQAQNQPNTSPIPAIVVFIRIVFKLHWESKPGPHTNNDDIDQTTEAIMEKTTIA